MTITEINITIGIDQLGDTAGLDARASHVQFCELYAERLGDAFPEAEISVTRHNCSNGGDISVYGVAEDGPDAEIEPIEDEGVRYEIDQIGNELLESGAYGVDAPRAVDVEESREIEIVREGYVYRRKLIENAGAYTGEDPEYRLDGCNGRATEDEWRDALNRILAARESYLSVADESVEGEVDTSECETPDEVACIYEAVLGTLTAEILDANANTGR